MAINSRFKTKDVFDNDENTHETMLVPGQHDKSDINLLLNVTSNDVDEKGDKNLPSI
jgi:hypothetical protein